MKKKQSIVIIALSLAVAVAGLTYGNWSAARRKAAEAETARLRQAMAQMEASLTAPVDPARPPVNNATNRPMERREEPLLTTDQNAPEPSPRESRPPRESFEDRMTRMKEEDPEGYAERIRQRQEFQQRMQYNFAERTATFMELDTAAMTDEERANHEKLVDKMATIWELTAQFQNPEQAPNRETMGQLYEQIREVRPLLEEERTIMFRQLGTEMGYTGDDAQAFADHVQKIIESTSVPMPRVGPGGSFGGGRGGGGDRGGSPAN